MTILLVLLTLILGLTAVGYAWLIYQKMMSVTVDEPRVVELSQIIHKGAMAFIKK